MHSCTRPAVLDVSHQNGSRIQHTVRPCEPETVGNKCVRFPVTINSSPAQTGCPARMLLRSAGEGYEGLLQLAMTEWPDCTQSCCGHASPHQAGRLDPPKQHSLQRTPCGAWGSLGTTCLPECHTALQTCVMIQLFLAAKERRQGAGAEASWIHRCMALLVYTQVGVSDPGCYNSVSKAKGTCLLGYSPGHVWISPVHFRTSTSKSVLVNLLCPSAGTCCLSTRDEGGHEHQMSRVT